ncbi:uncharacterized protein LOC117119053 [Anneissia japonica]|uniref:uncharacterized protein LOC117119053 n=1 Tax=Anneissia japonica TaxID=1529436 RepID=UPI001425705A|nr:uncharacterized protein LOC117119053 [Anneissia japonica]
MKQGIRQGCPLSALLFILVAEILATKIRTTETIKGIDIPFGKDNDESVKIAQLADDTVLFLKNTESITKSIEVIEQFGKRSGLELNKGKTNALWLGRLKDCKSKPGNLSWTTRPIKILGIHVGHDKDFCYKKNWKEKVESLKKEIMLYSKITIGLFILMISVVYILAQSDKQWSPWTNWYSCSESCREFRYRTCKQVSFAVPEGCVGENIEIIHNCPYTVKTLEEFQNGIQFARSSFLPLCMNVTSNEKLDINYCYESYGSVQVNGYFRDFFVHETTPVTYSFEFMDVDAGCTVSLVWDFVYEEWINQVKTHVNGSSRYGNYFQASKFFTISQYLRSLYPQANLHFPPSTVKPEVTLLDDSCSQAEISNTPICAYIDETHSISTVGCETVAQNFTYEGVYCKCPLADAYVVILEALPALKLPTGEKIVAVTGSGVNMASIITFFAHKIWNGLEVSTEGSDIFNNILSSILLANGALLFDESVDYFRESTQQDILAQSLAYSLITLNVWMLFWVVDKSIIKQPENTNYSLGSFYQIFGWTVPLIYVFLCSCYVENYASYNYRHWPNTENGAIWTLFGPMTGLFLISFSVCVYKLNKVGNMTARDSQERNRIRRLMSSIVLYLVALVFLFGKWSMGIWTTDIPLLQFIFSILVWVQFIVTASIYYVYNRCLKSSTTENGDRNKNDDCLKGHGNPELEKNPEGATSASSM